LAKKDDCGLASTRTKEDCAIVAKRLSHTDLTTPRRKCKEKGVSGEVGDRGVGETSEGEGNPSFIAMGSGFIVPGKKDTQIKKNKNTRGERQKKFLRAPEVSAVMPIFKKSDTKTSEGEDRRQFAIPGKRCNLRSRP